MTIGLQDRAAVVATAVLALVADSIRDRDTTSTLHEMVAAYLRDEFSALEYEVSADLRANS
jgi:hypothetical protein